MKDERLEALSDKVRKGEPIGFIEALEVIEYQENLKKQKSPSKFSKITKSFSNLFKNKKSV